MESEVPGVRQARYRLLGLQSVPYDDGIIIRRGSARIFVRGAGVGEVLDQLVAFSAEGRGITLTDVGARVSADRRETLEVLFARLIAERFLVPADTAERRGESREEIFYWNHRASFGAASGNLAEVRIAVFGINHVALPLVGNLRSCGFRAVTLVDHPALRNLDFFSDRQVMRHEIAGALSTPPRAFDEWAAASPKADCQVVCSDFGGRGLMRDWNRTAVAADTLFYPIVLEDEIAHLGPLVVPGEGPCFECLWAREGANLEGAELDRATAAHAFFGQRSAGYLQPMARIAADLAAIDLLKYFSGVLPGGMAGRLIEADVMQPAIAVRQVLKVPRCPVCALAPPPASTGEDGGPAP